jgi:hypothetical protein
MLLVPIGDANNIIRQNIGVFRRPEGVYWLNPSLLDVTISPSTGLATGATLKPGLFRHPDAGEIGYLGPGMFKTPRFFQADLGIQKKTRIHESANLEIRGELFNVFNNASFINNATSTTQSDTTLESQQFGRLLGAYGSRFAQITMRLNW